MKILLLCYFLFTTLITTAQEKKLLNGYKFRVSNYKQMNFDFLQNGLSEKTKIGTTINKSTGLTNTLSGNFNIFRSTDKWQQSGFVNLFTNYATTKGRQTTNNITQNNFAIQPMIGFNNRYYFNKLFFIETNIHTSVFYASSKNEQTNGFFSYNRSKVNGNFFNPTIGIGYGRLENITDMQNTLFLIKNLRNTKLLTTNLSNAETIELAQILTSARNTRLLDNRRFIKNVLKRVDAVLQNTKKLKETSIDYFTTLNDVLFFANNFYRLVGSRVSVLGNFGNSNNMQKSTYKSSNTQDRHIKDNTENIDLSINYESGKAISLMWHRNIFVNLQKGSTAQKGDIKDFVNGNLTSQTNSNETRSLENVSVYYGYAYYPNTRTVIDFGVSSTMEKSANAIDSEERYELGLYSSMNYFISYATTVQLKANVGGYQKKETVSTTTSKENGLKGSYEVKFLITL